MELARIDENGLLDISFCSPEIGSKFTELKNNGFLEFVSKKQPAVEDGYAAIDSYEVIDGKLVQSWSIKVCPILINDEIEKLKEELSTTDYMVTKCMEASLLGLAMPYDMNELHKVRQPIRDKINELEVILENKG